MDDISRYLEEQLRLSENELAAPNSTAQDLLTTDQTAEVPPKRTHALNQANPVIRVADPLKDTSDRRLLASNVTEKVSDPDGSGRKITMLDYIIKRLVFASAKGDNQAFKILMDLFKQYGRPGLKGDHLARLLGNTLY